MYFAWGFFIRITAKLTSYRVVFDLFSLICKKSRLTLCRKINLVRHRLPVPVLDLQFYRLWGKVGKLPKAATASTWDSLPDFV